jgi:hypothetical protein
MKKKLLSFLSLMVIAIFAFAATKGLQKADDADTFKVGISEGIKNGTIEVDKVTAAAGEEVTITATPDAGYKLVSYSVITYTSNEAVEVNDGKFIMPADQVIVGATFAAPEDITISPESGDISAALDEATTGAGKIAKNITINLAENGAYTITAPINATASVAINGAAGAKIDASDLTGAFINYASVNGVKAKKADETESNYTVVDEVTVKDVEITGLAKSFINNAAGNVCFAKMAINNAVIETSGSNTLFALGNGYPAAFEITNSTLYSKTSHTGFFVQAQGRPKDATGATSFKVDKSTLVNISVGKKANNNNSGIKGQSTTTLTLTNNILVNFGSNTSNEINGWLFGQNSTAPVCTYANNTYWSAISKGSVVSGWTDATKVGSDQTFTSLTTDPGFNAEKVADGDFTIGATTAQARMKTGDPRWLVDYVAPETVETKDIEIDAEKLTAAGNDIGKAFIAEKYAIINALNDFSGKVTVTLAENGAYTISSPIEATSDVVINGAAGAKINATKLTGNGFINYASVTGDKAMKNETTASAYTIVENITIKDVEFTALPKSIINSAAGKVLFKNILVSNAVIKMTGNVNVFGLGGGYPENLKIEKSTIWSDGVHKSFFFKADGKPADIINGTSTTTWTVDQSTLYNIAIGKKANNSNGGIKGKPTTYMVLTNSLLYNFGSSTGSEVNGWLWGQNGGAQATYSNNAYLNTDGTVTGWTDASKGGSDQTFTSIAGVMTFTSVETPDFGGNIELPYGVKAPDVAPGDPRWNVTFSNAAQQFDILIAEGIENGTVKTDKATAAEGDEITVTATPAVGFELSAIAVTGVNSDLAVVVTDGKFIMPADAVTISATFTQTTGVQAVKAEELKNAIIYTIGGQRVNSIKRGMFIINGRKVVVE